MTIVLTGLRAWLVQRASALYLLGFMLFLIAHFLFDRPRDFQAWHDWIAQPVIATTLLAGTLALLYHAWVGVRDVLLDYVHPPGIRVPALLLLAGGLIAVGLSVLVTVLRAA
ncbi:MAG TPA: succinate dehydrogenase, hydrophobic membrane anchor protein [Casimicrobiaceae bacterium]